MIRTLIVEDDYHVATIHAAYVKRVVGFEVAGHAASVASALDAVRRLGPDLVLLDLYLPDGSGLDLIRGVEVPRPDFLVISAARDMASVREAMQLGTVHYLVKPFGFAQLEERLAAYRSLFKRLERAGPAGEAEQHEVDAMFGALRGPAPVAKGRSGPTMSAVLDLLREGGEALSAAQVADAIGISRSTAQRYLSQLEQEGRVEVRLQYGATGRPEHLFRLA
jgi:response regulator of citrate/malate metabolism